MKSLCAVLLSGGVDSSVSAFILKERGFDLIAIHLKMVKCNAEDKVEERSCCPLKNEIDAREVAKELGIPFYVFNLEKEFEKIVIKNFIEEYRKGRTPNPCVLCNAFVRFPLVINKLKKMGVNKIATGHYVRKEEKNKEQFLLKGKDHLYDQSYFLYRVRKRFLKTIIFPVGNMTKEKVREIAKRKGFGIYNKRSSQDFCFIEGDYRDYLGLKIPEREGNIILSDGKVVGKHKGVHYFTVGQRKGLGSFGKPMYVIGIDYVKNTVMIGDKEEALKKKVFVEDVVFVKNPHKEIFDATVKIRYSHRGEHAKIKLVEEKKAVIEFEKPVLSPSPGQSAVFYDGDYLLGGGIIC